MKKVKDLTSHYDEFISSRGRLLIKFFKNSQYRDEFLNGRCMCGAHLFADVIGIQLVQPSVIRQSVQRVDALVVVVAPTP